MPPRLAPPAAATVLTAALVASVLLAAAPARGDGWRRPVPGALVGAFRFDRAHPYRAGQRRGVDLAAVPGAPVRSACAGLVTAAGPVPGRGRGVTVRCGILVATHLGLAAVHVRRGRRVWAGAVLGPALGPAVRLGARQAGRRHGYVDPALLLRPSGPGRPAPVLAPPRAERPAAGPPAAPAPGPVPWARPSRAPGPAPAVGPPPSLGPAPAVRSVAPRRRPVPGLRRPAARRPAAPGPVPPLAPALAWLGAALLAVALPAGGLAHRGARRRRRARTAAPAATTAARAGGRGPGR
jgi:hypothetical protein